MHLFGHTCMALMWARMRWAAQEALKSDRSDAAFHETKLIIGRYFMARWHPATALLLQRIQSGGSVVMDLNEEDF